jgi:hypothetical protein
VTDAEEVEGAFARYLDAVARLDDASGDAVGAALIGTNREVVVEDHGVERRRLEVVRIEGDEAEVVLEATTWTRGRHQTIGEIRHELRFDGPASARRLNGRWVVIDVTEHGRRRSESILLLAGAVTAGPVRLEPTSVNLGGAATRMSGRVVNRGDSPVLLTDAHVATRVWRLPWRYRAAAIAGGRECPPRDAVGALFAWQRLPLATREFRLLVKVAQVDSGAAYAAHMHVRPRTGTVEVLEGVPAQVRSPAVENAIRLAPFVPPVVLTAVHLYLAAAVVAFAEIAVFVAVLARWRAQRRTTNRQLAVGLLFAAAWAAGALVLLAWTR